VTALDPGAAYLDGLDRRERRRAGRFYTPQGVAERLVALAVDDLPMSRRRRATVCDLSVGSGVFLLAAAERLEAEGCSRRDVVADLLWGCDLDPAAVALTRAALRDWAAAAGAPVAPRHLVVGDGLEPPSDLWPDVPPAGFELVVGNPPFQSQLARDTARSAADLPRRRERFGEVVTPYVDTAALFLVAAAWAAAPGGRVLQILPESVLATRDAGAARAAVAEVCTLRGFWRSDGPVFDAVVDVCAPLFARSRSSSGRVPRWNGRDVEPASPIDLRPGGLAGGASWSALLATDDAPTGFELDTPDRLASIATATAGFRDQYYGIVPHVRESSAPDRERGVRLVTAGAIDPLRCRWSDAPSRFAGASWQAPVVDLAALERDDAPLARWARLRLVPKVVLATQTRVLEPVVDAEGSWWPSVPTISVEPIDGADLWRIGAVLAAPPVTAWALARSRGSALARDAIKLSAAQVLEVPLPVDEEAWRRGAAAAERGQRAAEAGRPERWRAALEDLGEAMTAAYGAPAALQEWWLGRLPPWRPGATTGLTAPSCTG
jgi:hypothetical protein